MKPHAPPVWVFIVSLIIAVIAVIGVTTPFPHITTCGTWVAILAYIVLAVGNLAKHSERPASGGPATCCCGRTRWERGQRR